MSDSLRIAVLSRGPRLYSTRRLREAGKARGHSVRVLDTLRCSMTLERGRPSMKYMGRAVPEYDAVIPRIGASITHFGCAVVRQFQQMGVFTANGSLGISASRDKLRCLQVLSRHRDLGMPATAFARDRTDVLGAIRAVGGAPVIIKLLEGTQGVGVILAETEKVAEAIVETLQSARQNVLIQKFVAESKGTDVRAFVVGDRVVAAMRRRAGAGEFRSNVHRGGSAEAFELPEAYERTAVRSAQIMGLRVAGVDMLEGDDGPKIMEVNSSPGLEGIERASGIDVAGAIIDFVSDHVSFPELDVRQRLTVTTGHVVSELSVVKKSTLAGKMLAESELREAGVLVLSVERPDGTTLAAPVGDTRLGVGDRLVCYGPQEVLRELVPKRKRRRVRKLPEAEG
ncbi:MAG: 30S ribosomal protein S6--L-glutamate ligase [Planctomycetota bacterium]